MLCYIPPLCSFCFKNSSIFGKSLIKFRNYGIMKDIDWTLLLQYLLPADFEAFCWEWSNKFVIEDSMQQSSAYGEIMNIFSKKSLAERFLLAEKARNVLEKKKERSEEEEMQKKVYEKVMASLFEKALSRWKQKEERE